MSVCAILWGWLEGSSRMNEAKTSPCEENSSFETAISMRSSRVWMKSSRMCMRSTRLWIISRRVVRASDSQYRSRNCPGFDHIILRHSGIRGVVDEAVLHIVHKKKKSILGIQLRSVAEGNMYIIEDDFVSFKVKQNYNFYRLYCQKGGPGPGSRIRQDYSGYGSEPKIMDPNP